MMPGCHGMALLCVCLVCVALPKVSLFFFSNECVTAVYGNIKTETLLKISVKTIHPQVMSVLKNVININGIPKNKMNRCLLTYDIQ